MEHESIIYVSAELPARCHRLFWSSADSLRGLHFHDEIELIRAEGTGLRCQVGEQLLTLTPGELLLINSRVIHRIFSSEPGSCCYLQADLRELLRFVRPEADVRLFTFLAGGTQSHFVDRPGSLLDGILSRIEGLTEARAPFFEVDVKGELLHLLAEMGRNGLIPSADAIPHSRELKRIRPALSYAEMHFARAITAEEVSEVMKTDRFYFCKLFKRATGRTFSEYVTFLRLSAAEEALLASDRPVGEIAFSCGFSSIQYFNRAFRAKNATTPRGWRAMNIRRGQ